MRHRTRRLTTAVAVPLLAAAAAALAWPDAAAGCSIAWDPRPWRSPTRTMMVLRGTRDSTTAGRAWSYAEWRSATIGGGLGSPASLWERVTDAWAQRPWRQRYGQVVLLDRVGGAGRDEIEALLARGQRKAVVVNWDHGGPCYGKLRVAAGGAHILPFDSTSALFAGLRPRALWASGLPTFDVIDGGEPYPHWQRVLTGRLSRGVMDGDSWAGPRPWLTPDEYLTLWEAVPAPPDRPPNAADYAELFAWERAHPDLARRYPAAELLPRAHELDGATAQRR